MRKLVCLYHYPCNDGFAAAWVLHHWRKQNKNLEIDFYPVNYNKSVESILDKCHGMDVMIVDFSYPANQLVELASVANFVTILDHHKTAKEELSQALPANVLVHFDMERSGAQMTWDHYFPSLDRPRFIDLIGNRDLWKKSPENVAFYEGLSMYPRVFEAWDSFLIGAKVPYASVMVDELISKGKTLIEYMEAQIEFALAEYSSTILLAGFEVPVCNMHYPWASEAGHKLTRNFPFSATFVVDNNGQFKFSLRSEEGGQDVGEIARIYGGGGHKHAAGFHTPNLKALHAKSKALGFPTVVESDGT